MVFTFWFLCVKMYLVEIGILFQNSSAKVSNYTLFIYYT